VQLGESRESWSRGKSLLKKGTAFLGGDVCEERGGIRKGGHEEGLPLSTFRVTRRSVSKIARTERSRGQRGTRSLRGRGLRGRACLLWNCS